MSKKHDHIWALWHIAERLATEGRADDAVKVDQAAGMLRKITRREDRKVIWVESTTPEPTKDDIMDAAEFFRYTLDMYGQPDGPTLTEDNLRRMQLAAEALEEKLERM